MNRKLKKAITTLGVSLGMFGTGYGIRQVYNFGSQIVKRQGDFIRW